MPRKRNMLITTVVVALTLIVGAVAYNLGRSQPDNKNNVSNNVQKYTHINISLKDGKLVGPISTYMVSPGTGLEFSITSDKLGKVGTPTYPPQTVTFTQSPLVFHFIASKVGSFPMTYQANGSSGAIEIGIVTVRSIQ